MLEGNILKKPRLLFYTDCVFFAGSEQILASILGIPDFTSRYSVTVGFNASRSFRTGLFQAAVGKYDTTEIFVPTGDHFLFRLSSAKITNSILLLFLKALKAITILVRRSGLLAPVSFISIFYLLKKVRPDFVFINNGGYPGALSARMMAMACRWFKIPACMMVHNRAFPARRFYEKNLDRVVHASLSWVITSSESAAQALIQLRGFSRQKVITLANTIATPSVLRSRDQVVSSLGLNPDEVFLLVQVGLLTKRKGQAHSIQALLELRKMDSALFEKCHLVLVGDGEERPYLEKLAKELGFLEPIRRVHFLGSQSQYADYIAAADVFLHPSVDSEDMPLVIFSAMDLGRAIVTSDVGGIVEQVRPGEEAIFAARGDSKSIAEAVSRILNDPPAKEIYGAKAKKRFQDLYSISAFQKRFEVFFQHAFGKQNCDYGAGGWRR